LARSGNSPVENDVNDGRKPVPRAKKLLGYMRSTRFSTGAVFLRPFGGVNIDMFCWEGKKRRIIDPNKEGKGRDDIRKH